MHRLLLFVVVRVTRIPAAVVVRVVRLLTTLAVNVAYKSEFI